VVAAGPVRHLASALTKRLDRPSLAPPVSGPGPDRRGVSVYGLARIGLLLSSKFPSTTFSRARRCPSR
jgi:hypothetical protein